jgi:hypothetical protein
MRECCQKPENLEDQRDNRPNVVIRKCKQCGARHIEFGVETPAGMVEQK